MDVAAVNAGYTFTKWRYKTRSGLFASVRGPANEALFSMGSEESNALALELLDKRDQGTGETWFVGREAIRQSLTLSRPESRGWIYTDEYHMLWHAALSEMTTQLRPVKLHVVTGLPVDYYRSQEGDLASWLVQRHAVKRVGRRAYQQFEIEQATVIPELLGILFTLCIDANGDLKDNIVSLGRVGVLDVGGHNTGFLVADALEPIRPACRSIDTGCWKAVQMVGAQIEDRYPGLGLRDHEVIDCMRARTVEWRGRTYDIGGMVNAAMKPVWGEISGMMDRLWNQRLGLIGVGGGGAELVADQMRARYPTPDYPDWYVQVFGSELLPDLAELARDVEAIYANVEGMLRYGRWLERGS